MYSLAQMPLRTAVILLDHSGRPTSVLVMRKEDSVRVLVVDGPVTVDVPPIKPRPVNDPQE